MDHCQYLTQCTYPVYGIYPYSVFNWCHTHCCMEYMWRPLEGNYAKSNYTRDQGENFLCVPVAKFLQIYMASWGDTYTLWTATVKEHYSLHNLTQ